MNEDEDENNLQDTSSDSDTALGPQELLDKYLKLQTLLFERQPELTVTNLRKSKGSKSKKSSSKPPVNVLDSISRSLLRRIARIQSDILFDDEEGYEKWAELRVNLSREVAERKKFHLNENRHTLSTKAKDTSSSPTVNSSDATNDEDSSIQLGDFFLSLPVSHIDSKTGASQIATTSSNGTSITVHDFGQTPGLSPRRILTEACKARWVRCGLRIYNDDADSTLPNS